MAKYQFGGHGEKIVSVIKRELGNVAKVTYLEGRVDLIIEGKGIVVSFIENETSLKCQFWRPVPIIEGVTEEIDKEGHLYWQYIGSKVDEVMMLAMAAFRNL